MPANFEGKHNFRAGDAWLDGDVSENVPTISSKSVSAGKASGGTTVVLTGTNFSATDLTVTFGGEPAASFVRDSATQITAVTPARPAGAQAIVVSNSDGPSAASAFTFEGVPTITTLNPATDVAAGGGSIVITGTGFLSVTGAAGVKFGGTNATSYVVNSATQITAVAPAKTAGSQPVIVTNPEGASAAKPFTYT